MADQENLFNKGYVASAVEATPGIAVTPTDYFQAYESNIKTNRNLEELAPAAGNVYGTQNVVAGLRDHMGDQTLIFEPNTAEKLFAMMLAMGGKSGSDPYTNVGTLSSSKPKTYTFDIYSGGKMVQRYFGCEVEKLVPAFSNNEVQIKPSISALGSFAGREVSATPTGTNPYTIALKTDYDPSPTTGLVVGDIMTYELANGTTINFAVASIVDGTHITTTTDVTSGAAGDMIYLRPATPSFNLLPPVLWSNTQFCFGATASAALSAGQTRVDQGSTWEIDYPFKDNKGEHRSGGQDPAVLLRKPAKVSLTIKKYFSGPADVEAYNKLSKSACVVRHFVYCNSKTYEIRITFNNLTTDDPLPQYKAGEINYSEIKYIPKYDTSDGQAFSVTVINANSSLT